MFYTVDKRRKMAELKEMQKTKEEQNGDKHERIKGPEDDDDDAKLKPEVRRKVKSNKPVDGNNDAHYGKT